MSYMSNNTSLSCVRAAAQQRSFTAGSGRAFFCLALATITAASVALCAYKSVQGAQTALTPQQREIEKERPRLASADTEERRDAVMRLGAMRRPDASRAAVPALQDPAIAVRATAAHAVLSLPADEAATLLMPLLADRQEFVRREVAYALGETRSHTAVDTLVTILARDKEAGVRGAAAVALGRISDERAVSALADALGRRIPGTGFFNRVTRGTMDENEFVRRAAAEALGRIGSRAAVPALIGTLTNEKAGDDVRREAARALGLIGDPTAVPALRSALAARDPLLAQIAFEVLRKLDPASATRPA